MTEFRLAEMRSRSYDAYASQHAGHGGEGTAALVYLCGIRPLLPWLAVDLSCGRGEVVRSLQSDGFGAKGVDISPEQPALTRAAAVHRVRQGDFCAILAARAPGSVFVGRVPNAVSPLGEHIGYGEFINRTSFTVRNIHQLAVAASFDSILPRSSSPVAQGLASAARVMIWQVVSAGYRIALAAATGMLRVRITTQKLTFTTRRHAEPVNVAERGPA